MDTPNAISISCQNILKDNQRWYAHRARHKKISILLIHIDNQSSENLQVDFTNIKIQSNGIQFERFYRDTLLKKLKQFTLDSIFSPLILTSLWEWCIEIPLFLFGFIYNRRLNKLFLPYYNDSVSLEPSQQVKSYIAFFNQKNDVFSVTIPVILPDKTTISLTCDVSG